MEQGDEPTLVAACYDVLRVVSAEEGTDYKDELEPVIEVVNNLSQPLEGIDRRLPRLPNDGARTSNCRSRCGIDL